MADISKEAYKPKDKRQENIQGFIYQKEFSTKMITVYKRGNQVIIGIKGTSRKKELFTDLSLVLGNFLKNKIFLKTGRKVREIIEKNKLENNNIYLTGHSLGGSIALWISSNSNIPSYSFNPGITTRFLQQIDINQPQNHIFMRKGDIVSQSRSELIE